MRTLVALIAAGAAALGGCAYIANKKLDAQEEKPGIQAEKLRVPPGYGVTVVARDLPGAREMALGPDGWLFVGSNAGNVYALNVAGGRPARTIVKGMKSSGVAYANGSLFVADRSQVYRYDNIASQLDGNGRGVTIVDGLPSEKRHGARFLAIGPDGKLYVSIGSPCDACEASNDEYGTIIRVNTDGSGREVVARGLRNSVGFDWHPRTGELWFTDNGPDTLGADKPDDELNRVSRTGENYGFPYCHNGTVPDPKFSSMHACSEFTAPVVGLGAHAAALGMRFSKADGSILVARHGSHPPSRVAYDVVRVKLDGNRATGVEPFLTGFLQGREYWGRPADVLSMADGSVLVADDLNGAIYRVMKQ